MQSSNPLAQTYSGPSMREDADTGFRRLLDNEWGPYEACIFRTSIMGKTQIYSVDTDVLYEIAKNGEITASALRDVDPVTALAIKKAQDALYPAKENMNRTPIWKRTPDGVQRELSGGVTEIVSANGTLTVEFRNAGKITKATFDPKNVNPHARNVIADALAQAPRPMAAF